MIGETQQDDFEAENLETNELGMGATTTGASTSAVSRLFSEGAFSDPTRRKYTIIGGAAAGLLLVLAIVFFVFGEDSGEEIGIPLLPGEEMVAGEEGAPPAEAVPGEAGMPGEGGMLGEGGMPAEEMVAGEEGMDASMGGALGGMQVVMPSSGQTRGYDETTGDALLQWEGAADYIVLARRSSLISPELRVRVSGSNIYGLRDAWPGTWYWRVESADGSVYSETQSFRINTPPRRNITLSQPSAGASISGNSSVSWTGDEKISYYRVEISSGNFSTPNYRFATVGTSAQLGGVMSGSYQLRVGGFSEVSGRWEYTDPIAITVQ